MRGGMFTQDTAQRMFDVLAANCFNAVLGFRYHERLIPAETYQVSVSHGPGRFNADRLRLLIDLAESEGCDVHLIGDALLLLPRGDT